VDDDAIWRVIDAERAGLADLLESLSPDEWERPSLCEAWTIRDVGAHLTLAPTLGLPEVLIAALRARGSFNRMVRDTAIAQARRPQPEIVGLLRDAVGSRRLAPGQKLKDALFDVLVHGQDIARPLGRTRAMPPQAAVVAADHLWQMGFPFHTRRRMRGRRLVATDVEWRAGTGAETRGPIDDLLLTMSGR
jgi:uncharacterized protein (TIGR03083 family)